MNPRRMSNAPASTPRLVSQPFKKRDAVIFGLMVLSLVLFVTSVIIYDQLRDTKSDYGKLIWCWEEYNAVDRSIEQCIIDKQGTLGECLYEWDHKFKLLTDVGCPYRPIEREELI